MVSQELPNLPSRPVIPPLRRERDREKKTYLFISGDRRTISDGGCILRAAKWRRREVSSLSAATMATEGSAHSPSFLISRTKMKPEPSPPFIKGTGFKFESEADPINRSNPTDSAGQLSRLAQWSNSATTEPTQPVSSTTTEPAQQGPSQIKKSSQFSSGQSVTPFSDPITPL